MLLKIWRVGRGVRQCSAKAFTRVQIPYAPPAHFAVSAPFAKLSGAFVLKSFA